MTQQWEYCTVAYHSNWTTNSFKTVKVEVEILKSDGIHDKKTYVGDEGQAYAEIARLGLEGWEMIAANLDRSIGGGSGGAFTFFTEVWTFKKPLHKDS